MSDSLTPRPLADWLRDAYGGAESGCPPPETWLAEELAALAPEQRAALERHAATCPACAAERELARAFDAAGTTAVPDVERVTTAGNAPPARVVAFPRRLAPAFLRLAAAAALVIAAGLTFRAVYSPNPSLPPPPGASIVRGGDVEALAPMGELAHAPQAFRWRAVSGAATYHLRLEAADGTAIWENRTGAAEARMPGVIAQRLLPGVRYAWSVEALAADGVVLARSATVHFRIAPTPEEAP